MKIWAKFLQVEDYTARQHTAQPPAKQRLVFNGKRPWMIVFCLNPSSLWIHIFSKSRTATVVSLMIPIGCNNSSSSSCRHNTDVELDISSISRSRASLLFALLIFIYRMEASSSSSSRDSTAVHFTNSIMFVIFRQLVLHPLQKGDLDQIDINPITFKVIVQSPIR